MATQFRGTSWRGDKEALRLSQFVSNNLIPGEQRLSCTAVYGVLPGVGAASDPGLFLCAGQCDRSDIGKDHHCPKGDFIHRLYF